MFDAIIRDYRFVEFPEGVRIVGKIHRDTKRFYPDGYTVCTSVIDSELDETGLIRTKNSTYKLEEANEKNCCN